MVAFSKVKDQPQQMIKVAAALRTKYRKGEKVRLPPFIVGFHPSNRGGAKLSGIRVLELMIKILEAGFDPEEADCGGIVVESSMVMAYNVDACEGDPLLTATCDGKTLRFGSLSHSHLHQMLKNILGGTAFDGTSFVDETHSALQTLLLDGKTINMGNLHARDPPLRTIRHRRSVI